MSTTNERRSVQMEATAFAMEIGKERARLALNGEYSPLLDEVARRTTDVILAAGEVIDPEEFGRRVRLRRRMDALRKKRATAKTPISKGEDLFPKPPHPGDAPVQAAAEATVETTVPVVRR